MIVSLGDVRAGVRRWDDETAARLASADEIQTLDVSAPDADAFWTVRLETLSGPRVSRTFGVAVAADPAAPAVLGRTWAGRVWIGAGPAVHAVDPRTGDVAEHGFESAFLEFFVPDPAEVLVVAYETGLRGYSPDGAELWRRDTDLIEDIRWARRTALVEQMDRPAVAVDLRTGEVADGSSAR